MAGSVNGGETVKQVASAICFQGCPVVLGGSLSYVSGFATYGAVMQTGRAAAFAVLSGTALLVGWVALPELRPRPMHLAAIISVVWGVSLVCGVLFVLRLDLAAVGVRELALFAVCGAAVWFGLRFMDPGVR